VHRRNVRACAKEEGGNRRGFPHAKMKVAKAIRLTIELQKKVDEAYVKAYG